MFPEKFTVLPLANATIVPIVLEPPILSVAFAPWVSVPGPFMAVPTVNELLLVSTEVPLVTVTLGIENEPVNV
ncbi:hypothetical protein D3C83_208430 [compost metagenome]